MSKKRKRSPGKAEPSADDDLENELPAPDETQTELEHPFFEEDVARRREAEDVEHGVDADPNAPSAPARDPGRAR